MTHDIRTGDVWRSEKSGRDVPVESVAFEYGYPVITYRGVKGAQTVALASAFVRGRKLIERSGVRVGDLRAPSKGKTLRVLSIAGDYAWCARRAGVRDSDLLPMEHEYARRVREGTGAECPISDTQDQVRLTEIAAMPLLARTER